MGPVEKALWFVESHSREPITLDTISQACGVSKFHLSRAFTAVTGSPIMRYLRSRRLSIAAHRLADGASDILDVALEAGYASHEAFTRAFHSQFGIVPERVRSRGTTYGIDLTEAMSVPRDGNSDIADPVLTPVEGLLLAGTSARYSHSAPGGIPGQWQRFATYIASIPGRIGEDAYGAGYDFDEEGCYSYLCGVAIAGDTAVPREFSLVEVPSQWYAVFTHKDHIGGIGGSYAAIWRDWVPERAFSIADAPTIERYTPSFDATTGRGGVEIRIPLDRA